MAARFPDAQRRMRPRTATILAAVVGVWFGSAGEDPGPGIFIGALVPLGNAIRYALEDGEKIRHRRKPGASRPTAAPAPDSSRNTDPTSDTVPSR